MTRTPSKGTRDNQDHIFYTPQTLALVGTAQALLAETEGLSDHLAIKAEFTLVAQ